MFPQRVRTNHRALRTFTDTRTSLWSMPSLNIVCIIIFYPYKISLGKAELLISFDRSSYAIFDGIELFTNKGHSKPNYFWHFFCKVKEQIWCLPRDQVGKLKDGSCIKDNLENFFFSPEFKIRFWEGKIKYELEKISLRD